MKKVLGLVTLLWIATSLQGAKVIEKKEQPSTLCKLFNEKAKLYEKTMRNDDYARATLASYKKRAAVFCKKGK